MVLFVMAVHNYWKYTGFRLDSELYSAHPREKEILFAEGTRIAVIGVDEIEFASHAFNDSRM